MRLLKTPILAFLILVGLSYTLFTFNNKRNVVTCYFPKVEAASDAPTIQDKPKKEHTVSEPSTETHAHTNRLINETSPYLLQHAHNPVDWYPWGDEALTKAKEEDKPIFLSIGYSACHWCHVMENECFENEEVAALLNEHFINIKVDREERPDIDEIYMAAVQAMTGSGGWPMSVFITPDLKPFFGGTYFPKDSKYGRPGFITILNSLVEAWEKKREQITKSSNDLTEHMINVLSSEMSGDVLPTAEIITQATDQLQGSFDGEYGGFGSAPKFPSSPSIALLLREYKRNNYPDTLKAATVTLDRMAQGGIYDHLGGGFSRYSVDDQWLVPHFEKMLYDNAQLAQVYLEAYQLTGNNYYRKIVEDTFTYIMRDMRDERGGFYSAEDADSEGEEGKFYIWDKSELVEILGEDDAHIFNTYYNVKDKGNFSSHESYHAGKNVLHTPLPDPAVAELLNISVEELHTRLKPIKEKVLAIRNQRVRPGLDDKVLTSWNALMITAFAQGYQVLGDEMYRSAAVEASQFLLNDMTRDGELLRTHRKGESRLPAYLDDYAFTVAAFLDVYESTFDIKWITAAQQLTDTMNIKFWDNEAGEYYFTSDDHKNLIMRTRNSQDSAVPSGNSVAAYALLRLAKYTDTEAHYEKAERILKRNSVYLDKHPLGFTRMLCTVDFLVYPPKEITIVGALENTDTQALLNTTRSAFIPNKIVAHLNPTDSDTAAHEELLPLLKHKVMLHGKATAYVCKNFTCKEPVTDTKSLIEQLAIQKGE